MHYQQHYTTRRLITTGNYEPTDEECTINLDQPSEEDIGFANPSITVENNLRRRGGDVIGWSQLNTSQMTVPNNQEFNEDTRGTIPV